MKRLLILLISLMIAAVVCGQEVLKRDLELRKTAPLLNLNGSGAVLQFYNGDVSLTQSSNLLTLSGGNFSLGANSLLGSGSIGATGSRLLKGWFTDLEITNSPTVNGVSIASIYAPLASPTFTGTVTGTFSGNLTGNVTGTSSLVTGFTRNGGTLTLSGGHGITFTTTGTTTVTLPTSGTLMTKAGGEAIESRVDSIVAVLADTMNIETLLGIDLDTDTVASQKYARDAVNDTMLARIAAATVGLAAADTNTYGGATTRTFVESLLGSGEGLSAQRLPFIIGVTTGAPSASDTIVVHSEFEGKHIDLYRDGAKQYQHFTATNTLEGFRVSGDTIYVNPAWQANEQVLVDIIQPILWSYLSLEGEESSLLDSLNGYWKFDESSGTAVVDATGTQNGTTNATAGVAGKLNTARDFDAATDVVNIAYNANTVPSGADFSVAMWFKIDSLPSVMAQNNYLFQQNVGADPWSAHWLYVASSDDKLHASTRNTDGTAYSVLSTDALDVDTWYHVVFVNRGDGQTLQMYVNGTDVSAFAGTFTGTLIEAASTTCFGNAYSGASSYFDGIIDSPAIWNRALTSDDVTALYNAGLGNSHPFN